MVLKSIKAKLVVLSLIPVAFFTLIVLFYIAPSIQTSIYNEKETQTKDMVASVNSIAYHYYEMERSGQVSRMEAQKMATEAIRSIRFGDNALDYIWINDFEPKMIMHPFTPELEGTDVSELKTLTGLIFLWNLLM